MACTEKCEVYSRIVGYFRPLGNWNIGKKEEFALRKEYDIEKALTGEFTKQPVSESMCSCTEAKIATE